VSEPCVKELVPCLACRSYFFLPEASDIFNIFQVYRCINPIRYHRNSRNCLRCIPDCIYC